MAIQNELIYELVTPKSESNPDFEEFEFLLEWYDRNGALNQYLFTDWENETRVRGEVLNIKDESKLSNLLNQEQRSVGLIAENISLNDVRVISGIAVAKRIRRRFKDGTMENVGVDRNRFRHRQLDGRYDIEIGIVLFEKALPT